MLDDYIKRILTARVYDVARETPLDPAAALSRRLGSEVLLKREDLQPVFSYKLRGAYNRIINLEPEQRARGVIAASAGNHAQGVALSAKRLGIPARIVMPKTTPDIKIAAVRALDAEIVLHGSSYDEAFAHCMKLAEEGGMAFIPPYDDPVVIAGQGTVALELMRQSGPELDAVFVPVGGGGLAAGMAAYIKSLYPEIRLIGVEPVDAPTLHAALGAGERVQLEQVGIFADGVAVRRIGEEPFRVLREHIDEVVLVSSDAICAAIKDIFDDTRSIAEPAGALAVAGLKQYLEADPARAGGRYAAVVSGANINFDRLRHVAERAELGERREALFAVTIPERPGSFRAFCNAIGTRAITEFNYRYAAAEAAQIFVGIRMNAGAPEKEELREKLESAGYAVTDLTDNEMAKLHVRHMVGGRAPHAGRETLYRFEFPERPGALMRFLSHLHADWNISLFHYRNHGADYGRVLAGFQVPEDEEPAFREFLRELGYPWEEETENPAYGLFLR